MHKCGRKMTENQIHAMQSGGFIDNSSGGGNFIRYDSYANTIAIETPQYTFMDHHLRENPMLTTAISIPQRGGGSYQPRIMADFSELGLDALDASSLSPNVLQDVNLSDLNNTGGQYNIGNVINSNTGDNITLYEIQNAAANSNAMWSDIGNAMVTTKTEPFTMDEDYIFQIDKADLIQEPTLAELNDEALLEDLNIEDLIHTDQESYLISHHGHIHQITSSPAHLNSPITTSSLPPQQLLQQNQNQHHNQHQQHQQQQHQQQQAHHAQHQTHQNQQLSLQLQNLINRDVMYDEQNTTGSSSPYDIYQTTPTKSLNSSAAFSPSSHASSNSPLLINSVTPPPHTSRSQFHQNMMHMSGKTRSPALQELLKKEYSMSPDRNVLGQSVPGPSTPHMLMTGTALSPASSGFGSASRKVLHGTHMSGGTVSSRLSSSAPTHLGLDQIWQRREPRQHLLSTGSLAEAESFSSISTGSVLSPERNDLSHDEGYSDYDSDHYEDYSTDGDSDNEDGSQRTGGQNSKNKERYFWQYNVQAKGPKGQRLVIKSELEDPHVLNEVTDPVFSPNCSVRGIKHSGKARKGDGNDLTPNPRKLSMIGRELDKLGRTINDMTPVSELPFNVRPKSRKEKNKLASRACRLKKKAQHEANKIKLYGLEVEHKKLINGINDIKRILAMKYQHPNERQDELNQQVEKIVKSSTKVKIAGQSTEFVNKVLEKIKSGSNSGGLEDLKNA